MSIFLFYSIYLFTLVAKIRVHPKGKGKMTVQKCEVQLKTVGLHVIGQNHQKRVLTHFIVLLRFIVKMRCQCSASILKG